MTQQNRSHRFQVLAFESYCVTLSVLLGIPTYLQSRIRYSLIKLNIKKWNES